MHAVKDLEIGLVFWAGEDFAESIRWAKQFGVHCGQLGIPESLSLTGKSEEWAAILKKENFAVVTAVCSFNGEDYTDIPAVFASVGYLPVGTRAGRVARTKEVADFVAALGITSIACHVGFVPEDHNDPAYHEIRDVVRDICDHCAAHGQTFVLETGQEPAGVLLRFIHDVKRQNLGINFDPANMILYGTGNPIEALDVLGKLVVSTHCKDGDWPPTDQPNALGKEKALGTGSVGIPEFIAKLKQVGYRGILSIEREEPDQAQRAIDIHSAVKLLKSLV